MSIKKLLKEPDKKKKKNAKRKPAHTGISSKRGKRKQYPKSLSHSTPENDKHLK